MKYFLILSQLMWEKNSVNVQSAEWVTTFFFVSQNSAKLNWSENENKIQQEMKIKFLSYCKIYSEIRGKNVLLLLISLCLNKI